MVQPRSLLANLIGGNPTWQSNSAIPACLTVYFPTYALLEVQERKIIMIVQYMNLSRINKAEYLLKTHLWVSPTCRRDRLQQH